ncbi:MAG: MFS transporter [Bacillota bacterium]
MYNIIILGLVSMFNDISTEMIYPLMPIFITSVLGASPAVLGLIEGIAESLASLLKVFFGYIGDKTRKRKGLAITGYGSSTIGRLFLYAASSWGWVLTGRVIDRFGKGIRTAPRDALIADSTDEATRGRAFGLHRALDSLGAVIGSAIAFVLLTRFTGDFRTIFLISMVPALFGVALLFIVKEPPTPAHYKPPVQPLKAWSQLNGRLKAFLLVTLIFAVGNSSNTFLLLRAKDLGLSASTVVLVYTAYNAIYSGLSYPIGRISDRIGRPTLLIVGYAISALVYLGFAVNTSVAGVWALFLIYGVYIALTDGIEKAFLVDLATPEMRGTVIGLHAAIVGLGLLPASAIAGVLWDRFGAAAPFYYGGATGLIAAGALWLLLSTPAKARTNQ